jgi:imidazolonepropionase-like amidohydrolase
MELVLLVDAGLTTAEALAAATINPARAIGRGNEQGTVERGKLADLLILDAEPLGDIHNVSTVFKTPSKPTAYETAKAVS